MKSIDAEKEYFKKKCKYAKNGVKVVTGRNDRFYKSNSPITRWKIRKFWREKVRCYLKHYKKEQDQSFFLKNVSELQSDMNKEFKGEFYRGDFSFYEALMSLSTALKYKWCTDKECAIPPLCPINKDVRGFLNEDWGALPNRDISEKTVRAIYENISQRDFGKDVGIKGVSIAEWELCVYNDIYKKTYEK